MKKKLLTVEDLVTFCQKQHLYSFNSRDSGYQLCIQVPAQFNKDEEDEEESSLLFATVKAFHTGTNRNHSNVTIDAAKKAMKTMAYKPILANFTTTESGELDFTSHDFTVNENGEIDYQERQIGCFTADEPYLEQDPEKKDRQYICAKCAIPKEYTAAADIIERKNGTKVSAELLVNSMEYNSKDKELLLTDIELSGLTCLGINPETGDEVAEGMEGSRLDIADFSVENNSICSMNQLDIMQELKQSLDNYITVFTESMKGGNNTMDNFEEDVKATEPVEEEVASEQEVMEATEDEIAEDAATEESTEEVTVTEAESEETTDVTPSENDNVATMSVTINGVTKTFSRSLVEKLSALSELINATYGETDNDYFDVDADEDNKEVYAHGLWSGKHFKQKYTVKKDIYSLQGDRIDVYGRFLTLDEIKQLDQMKANYSEMEAKLQKYKSEPEKMDILNSADYSSIAESDEFVAFKEQDAHFDLSVDEVRAKADEMLLTAAKKGGLDFAQEDTAKPQVTFKPLPFNKPSARSRYGGLGKKKED